MFLYSWQLCLFDSEKWEDCSYGQVQRRACHQRQNQKQGASKWIWVNIEVRYISYPREQYLSFKSVGQILFTLFLSITFSFLLSRAQRVGTASHPVRRRKTSCHLTRSRSREKGRGRDNERGRSERWRDADARKEHARGARNSKLNQGLIKHN